MGKYKKRSDGRYATSVLINGKRKYIYGSTIAELDMKLSEMRTDSSRGTYAEDKGLTLKQWADIWMKTYKSSISEPTRNNYRLIIDSKLTPIHDLKLKDVRKHDVQELINAASGHYDTQRMIKLVCSGMFKDAIDDGLLYRDVTYGIKLPKKPKSDTRALTDQERNAIDLCDFTSEEKTFVYLLLYTGIRPEEARALTKNDINFRKKTISINKAITFGKNQPIMSTPKTENGYRTIPILEPLFPILRDFITEKDLYLFTNASGNIHTKTTYRRFWEKIRDKINAQMGGTDTIRMTDLSPYVFRHTFATNLYYSDIDIKEAARLMGHADIKLILQVYAELDDKKSNSTEKLERFFKGV